MAFLLIYEKKIDCRFLTLKPLFLMVLARFEIINVNIRVLLIFSLFFAKKTVPLHPLSQQCESVKINKKIIDYEEKIIVDWWYCSNAFQFL